MGLECRRHADGAWTISLAGLTTQLFLWVQLATAVVLLQVAGLFRVFEVPTVTKRTCIDLLPLAALNGLGLALNTYCLRFVDASFCALAQPRTG